MPRELALYFGVNWTRLYGQTADYARAEEDFDDIQFVIGLARLILLPGAGSDVGQTKARINTLLYIKEAR